MLELPSPDHQIFGRAGHRVQESLGPRDFVIDVGTEEREREYPTAAARHSNVVFPGKKGHSFFFFFFSPFLSCPVVTPHRCGQWQRYYAVWMAAIRFVRRRVVVGRRHCARGNPPSDDRGLTRDTTAVRAHYACHYNGTNVRRRRRRPTRPPAHPSVRPSDLKRPESTRNV